MGGVMAYHCELCEDFTRMVKEGQPTEAIMAFAATDAATLGRFLRRHGQLDTADVLDPRPTPAPGELPGQLPLLDVGGA